MKSRDCLAGRKSSAPPKSRASMGCQGRSSLGLGDKVESSQTVSINKGRSVVLYPYAVKNIKWHFSSFFPTLSIVKLHFKGGGGEKRLFFFLNSKAHCESSFERANFTIGIFIWKQQPKMLTLCRVPRPLCIDQCVCLLLSLPPSLGTMTTLHLFSVRP